MLNFIHGIKAALMTIILVSAMTLNVQSNDLKIGGKDGQEIAAWVDAYAGKALKEGPAAGMSILVAKGGDIIFAKAYGYADLENKTPSKVDTIYQVGSITKQFTAVAILQLEEQGKLSLDDDITKFLPNYPTHGEKITVGNLLYHTSGIKNYIRVGFSDSRIAPGRIVNNSEYRLDLRPEEMMVFFKDEPLEFPPGSSWNYSNSGYFLAGLIIEKVSGLSYADYVEKNLFDKASMTHSSYTNFERLVNNRARGYKVKDGQLLNSNAMDMSVPYAAGALSSTVTDLFKWNRQLHEGHKLLEAATYDKLITPGTLDNGTPLPLNYALGLGAAKRDGHMSILHPGGINGFSGMASYFPENEVTIVVLTNTYNKKMVSFADKVELAVGSYLFNADPAKFDFH